MWVTRGFIGLHNITQLVWPVSGSHIAITHGPPYPKSYGPFMGQILFARNGPHMGHCVDWYAKTTNHNCTRLKEYLVQIFLLWDSH